MPPYPAPTVFMPTRTAHNVVRAETTIPPEVIAYTSTFGIYSPWDCPTGTYFAGDQLPPKHQLSPLHNLSLRHHHRERPVQYDVFGVGCSIFVRDGHYFRDGGGSEAEDVSRVLALLDGWELEGDWKAVRTPPTTLASTATATSTTTTTTPATTGGSSILHGGKLAAVIVCATLGAVIAVAACIWAYKRHVRKQTHKEDPRIATQLTSGRRDTGAAEERVNADGWEIGEGAGPGGARGGQIGDNSRGSELFLKAETSHDVDHKETMPVAGSSSDAQNAARSEKRDGMLPVIV
ncbi:hypothetical protein BDV96DRAFT_605431 [Lophiotrema nucula]|uniref:Uncharacterized protein n=1 Tax=Lophiotrema nucula TaxID=690887 RepID=A0A6A5YR98_9PLEO|nr:hypothetical protein BDV96DRAFT_605431 [Lophiotrema nucula]